MTLTDGSKEAGQSGFPTSLNDFPLITRTTMTQKPVTQISEVRDWNSGLLILTLFVLVLVLVNIFKKK